MTRPMTRVYLAGPINGCTDAEALDWRAEVTRALAGIVECEEAVIASHLLDSAAVFVTATAFARYVLPALEAWRHWIAARRDRLNIIARAQARDLRNYKRHGTL